MSRPQSRIHWAAAAILLVACATSLPRVQRYEWCQADSSDGVSCQCPDATDLRALSHNPKIGRLEVNGMNDATDLSVIAGVPNLRKLVLREATQAHLRGLTALHRVEELVLLMADDERVFSLAPVASMKNLRVLTLACAGEADVSALKALDNLEGIIVDRHCRLRGAAGSHLEARIALAGSPRVRMDEPSEVSAAAGGALSAPAPAPAEEELASICSIDPEACRIDPCRRQKPEIYTLD